MALAAPASASPWEPVKGNWRTTEIASCGIDDVRAGRILSMGDRAIRYGFLLCVIQDGTSANQTISVTAQCDLGGGYETPMTYEWILTGPHTALMRLNGYDTALVRCEKGIE
ncbi:MAG: hypothetical protein AAF367_03225 [Pseudomonadota bacterium]